MREAETNARRRYRARYVVNATGAWGPLTAAFGGIHSKAARIRPGKGIHVVYDRRLSNYAIVADSIDGRRVFLEPWQNVSIIGTTDDDYFGNLDDVTATSEEVRYLVQGIARVFPSIRTARAIGTYAGVRPTIYDYGPDEDSLSREHLIVDHAVDGAEGVFSMLGGKLASYRLFSQEMSDRLARDLCPGVACTTHEIPLPGGEKIIDPFRLAGEIETTPIAARRLVFRHGTRANDIGVIAREESFANTIVCPCEPVTEAEIRYVVRNEGATSVADVSRRTRLGLGACGGMRCTVRCAQIVAEERELSPRESIAQAKEFFEQQARTRLPVIGTVQARQEVLHFEQMHSLFGTRT